MEFGVLTINMTWSHRRTKSKNPLNILILVSNNQVGGITSAVTALSQGLGKEFDVQVGYFGEDWQKGIRNENWIRFKTPLTSDSSKIFKFLYRLKSLVLYLRQNKCDIVICHDPSSVMISYLSRLIGSDFKIIGMCHVSNDLLTYLDKKIIKVFYPKLQNIVVPSTYLARELKSIQDLPNMVVIPNSLSESITTCVWPRNKNIKYGSYIFLGRLEEEKNPKLIVEMARIDPGSNYVFCGYGSQSKELKETVNHLGLKNVSFLGYRDASSVLNLGSVVIIPSITESFGVVAIESWLHGVPTLVSGSSKGVLEMLDNEDLGLEVGLEEEVQVWVEAAKKLSQNRISDVSMVKILENYHSSAQTRKWNSLLI